MSAIRLRAAATVVRLPPVELGFLLSETTNCPAAAAELSTDKVGSKALEAKTVAILAATSASLSFAAIARNLCENFKVNEQKLILIFGQNSPSFIYLNHGIFSNFTTC